jgi:hypothetical protein
MKSFVWRVIASLGIIALFRWAETAWSLAMQVALSDVAVGQLSNSDAALVEFTLLERLFNSGVLPVGLLVALLVWLWWAPVKKVLSGPSSTTPLALALVLTAGASGYAPDAMAYYDKKDYAEWAEIGANQSAFLIPMTGANKDKQAKFGSIEYLEQNKVGAKRVQIPHMKADNTGAMVDYYVPTHRLFILDRAPFTREWHNAANKGTSAKSEGFRFESADSLTIETAITISALVREEDAAKFFYWFGTTQTAPSTAPEVVFASINYGRSLAEVMDTVVRARVQAALAKEFGKLPLMQAIGAKAQIIDKVEAVVKEEFASKGITILFVGYADELTLSPNVQNVLNEVFVMNAKYANRASYTTVLDLERTQAQNSVIVAQGKTMEKWDGKINLPSFLIISEGITNWISGMFGGHTAKGKP